MKLQTLGFDWDVGNRRKCQKHGLHLEEIELFFRQENIFVMPDINHSQSEDRYIAYGSAPKERPLFVVFTFRMQEGDTLIRPISARYMHQKEAREYEEKSTKVSQ